MTTRACCPACASARTASRQGALASIESYTPAEPAKYSPDGKVTGAGMGHYGDGEHYVTEMDEELISTVVEAFGDAAEMAMLGGCDMVTVQAAHGWLFSQFLSPNTNKRTDRFGGSIENRARLHVMVAENIRKKCGDGVAIDFRLSGSDFMENSATLEDVVQAAKLLDGKVDMLHISAATFDDKRASIRMFPCMFYDRGCNAFLAEEINTSVPSHRRRFRRARPDGAHDAERDAIARQVALGRPHDA